MFRRKLFISIFLLIIGCGLSYQSTAQCSNQFISDQTFQYPADSGRYGLDILANAYLRNTEYFNKIELGRTLFGYQINPTFYIQPVPYFSLKAGIYARNDYGNKSIYTNVLPTFTLALQHKKNIFLFGTLDGALSHQLVEPLMDISSNIERRIENGFQYKRTGKNLTDIWINWERFIQRGDPWKEEFTAGIHYNPVVYKNDNKNIIFSIPFQFTAHHRGGQIDSDSSNMIMVFNSALGLEMKHFHNNGFIRELAISAYHLRYRENSNSGYFPFKNGQGNFFNFLLKSKHVGLLLSYWHGTQYIAPRGTTIYQSVSTDFNGYTESQRKLLFIRFLYEKEVLPHLFLVVRYEPFLDLINKTRPVDYSYSVYITYRERFALGQLKRW